MLCGPERPRFVMFSSAELGEASGPAIHVINLANALSKHAIVTLVVPKPKAAPVVPLAPEVCLRNVPSPRTLGLPGGLAFALMLPALWQNRTAEIIQVRSAPGSILLALAARLFAVRQLAVELNGWIAGEAGTLGARGGILWLLGKLQIIEAKRAHVIRTVTPELKDKLTAAGIAADKIIVIPTGAQLDAFRPLDRQHCRLTLGLPDEERRAVFIGNLWDAIDLKTVFRALGLLQLRGIPLKLSIVGDGPARVHLEASSHVEAPVGAVQFLGSLPPHEAAIHLGAADFAIAPFSPAHAGLSPLKIRDYAAGGRLIVASDLPGIRLDGSADWLITVKAQDDAAMAQGMARALQAANPERESSARAFAEAHFSWQGIATAILNRFLNAKP